MSSPADPFSILNRDPGRNQARAPQPKQKILRYRSGVVPNKDLKEDDDNDDIFPNEITHFSTNSDTKSVADSQFTTSTHNEKDIKIPKRREIQRTIVVEDNEKEIEEEKYQKPRMPAPDQVVLAERVQRKLQQRTQLQEVATYTMPEIVPEDQSITADKVEEVVRRRNIVKPRVVQVEKVQDAEALQELQIGKEQEEESENDEDDTEEDEEFAHPNMLLKPVFVSKQERETNNKLLEEEVLLKEEERKLKEKKKLETKLMVIEAVRKDDLIEEKEEASDGETMPNDDDGLDQANEFEIWKIRELKRIKRDKEELHAREKELKEIERRRKLTDAQREEENRRLGADAIKSEKTAYKFMQKYYHKGAYYQDNNDPIFQRDFNVAIGEENFDKSTLPGVLQLKRGDFGKKGRSKWTHLSNEDTTNFDPTWRGDESIKEKLIMKQAGYKGVGTLDRPTSKKKHI